jgi:uncharacterized protein
MKGYHQRAGQAQCQRRPACRSKLDRIYKKDADRLGRAQTASQPSDHGLDLADAETFDWEAALVLPGYPGNDRRPRYRAIGRLHGDLVALVFSPLGTEAIAVISLRRASRRERQLYEETDT